MTGAGAVYYLVPRLARQSLPCLHLARIHLLASLLGLPLLVLSLAIGGLVQGAAYNDHRLAFGEVVKTVQPYLLAAAVGLGLLAVAQLAFVFNLALLLKQATTAALRRQREISAPPNCLVQT
jgi:cbb3-type cytochrome oxidase subunit 1